MFTVQLRSDGWLKLASLLFVEKKIQQQASNIHKCVDLIVKKVTLLYYYQRHQQITCVILHMKGQDSDKN